MTTNDGTTTESSTDAQDTANSFERTEVVDTNFLLAFGDQVIYATVEKQDDAKIEIELRAVDSPQMDYKLSIQDRDTGDEAAAGNEGNDVFGSFEGKIDGATVTVTKFDVAAAPRTAPKPGVRGVPGVWISLNDEERTWLKLWDYLEETDRTWELKLVLEVTPRAGGGTREVHTPVTAFLKRYLDIVSIPGGKLREDVARKWKLASAAATAAGAPVDSPYADTFRGTPSDSVGASRTSLHNIGRAVDLNMKLWGKRYFPVDEGTEGLWTVWCRADRQDGSQGERIEAGAISYWHAATATNLRSGYYVNLSALLRGFGFTGIRRHSGWKRSPFRKAEWWHFNDRSNLAATFALEMQKVGLGRTALLRKGWSEAELDKRPG